MAELLEAMMLVCFGLSWPISVIKNIKSRSAKNMSLRFTLLIIFGYIFGIVAKLMNGVINYVLIVYFINLVAVSMNVVVYFVNKKIDKNEAVGYVAKSLGEQEAV
jgi:uncharacterized membrane protein